MSDFDERLSDEELEAFFDDETLELMRKYEHMRKEYNVNDLKGSENESDE